MGMELLAQRIHGNLATLTTDSQLLKCKAVTLLELLSTFVYNSKNSIFALQFCPIV